MAGLQIPGLHFSRRFLGGVKTNFDLLLELQCPTDSVLLYKLSQVIFQLLSHLFVLAYKMQNVQVCHLCSFFFSVYFPYSK